MQFRTTLIAVVIASLPGLAAAQATDTTSTKRIDQRQANQEKRIEQGEKSGQLNQKEAKKLEKGQAHVQKMENKAVSDGKVTQKERARIEHAQDQQSKKIQREKHDKQTSK